MSVLKCLDSAVEVEGVGYVTLGELLEQKEYGKIYVSLGINDVGYDMDFLVESFGEIYDFLRENEPEAIVYVMASMHVAKDRAMSESIFQSDRVNEMNRRFGEFADGEHSFYIDENTVFDDAEGFLNAEYTGDSVHLYAKYYELWDEFLCRNAVVKPGMKYPGDAPLAPKDTEAEPEGGGDAEAAEEESGEDSSEDAET